MRFIPSGFQDKALADGIEAKIIRAKVAHRCQNARNRLDIIQ
jgi:hypothetical protein